MVVAIPLLLLPIAEAFAEGDRRHSFLNLWILFSFTLTFVYEQIYSAMGKAFSFYQMVNWTFRKQEVNVFQDGRLYLDLDKSQLSYILGGERGPFLLPGISLSNGILFLVCAAAAGTFLLLAYVKLLKRFVYHSSTMAGTTPPLH